MGVGSAIQRQKYSVLHQTDEHLKRASEMPVSNDSVGLKTVRTDFKPALKCRFEMFAGIKWAVLRGYEKPRETADICI